MRVFILSPALGSDGIVTIRTEDGVARVVWKGAKLPSFGEANVELTLRGRLRWGIEVVPAPSGERVGIREDGSVVAALDGVDADGVVKLRLADGVAMIAPTGKQPPISVGDLVHVVGIEIDIYPENV